MHDFVMPVGPQSPALKEPMLLKLKLEGEEVRSVDMRLGYTHKGVEGLLEGKNVDQAMYVASRICGICSISHERAFIRTVEDMMKKEVNERVKLIRTILFELERISSHLLWAGFMMHEIGFDTLFQYLWREREGVLDLFESICGNRVHKNICKIGSLRYDIAPVQEREVLDCLDSMQEKLKDYEDEIKKNKVIKERLKGVGKISKKTAIEYGLIGPNARASGIDNDVRRIDPYDSYADINFKTIVIKKGDAMERTLLRMREVHESMGIIRQCVEMLPSEKIPKFSLTNIKEGEAIGRVEAPRGELFYFLKVEDGLIRRAKVRTPTFAFIKILEKILKGVKIGDVPVIVASLDPCFSCMERVLVAKEDREEWMTEAEFRRKYSC